MSFQKLGLSVELLRAISEKGYNRPTSIQQQAIPKILQGLDLLASAQTGTGKTAAFTLPLLHLLSQKTSRRKSTVRALVITPTRELATQIHENVISYSKHLSLSTAVIYGGVSISQQILQLRRGVDVLIATPGRLLDHVQQNFVNLTNTEILVLDEADRMLDGGFVFDINKILSHLPKQRQSLLFSATVSTETKKLADRLLKSPIIIQSSKKNSISEKITQVIHPVDRKLKSELLSYLIGSKNLHQVLVFTRTKSGADRLSKRLNKDGIVAEAIHGDKNQGARAGTLNKFKQHKVRVLVATDVAARGLDINRLSYVVNFELPYVPADYLHRIGRTGRAGNEGQAFSLVCVDENNLLKNIESLIKHHIPKVTIPGYEPDPTIKVEPVSIKSGQNLTRVDNKTKIKTAKTCQKGSSQSYNSSKNNSHYKLDSSQSNHWNR